MRVYCIDEEEEEEEEEGVATVCGGVEGICRASFTTCRGTSVHRMGASVPRPPHCHESGVRPVRGGDENNLRR